LLINSSAVILVECPASADIAEREGWQLYCLCVRTYGSEAWVLD
jgi:hypothetical protein